jgi:Na+/melibiose symporter-like transporter
MISMNKHCDSAQPFRPFMRSVAGIVCVILMTIFAAMLMNDPQTHVLGALAFLPLLLCPLIHLFMKHRRHGYASGVFGNEKNVRRAAW